MHKYILKITFFTIVLTSFAIPADVFAFEGPMQIKNQFPLFTHLNPLSFEAASLENSYSINLSHSTVHLVQNSQDWSMSLDMEWTELNIRGRKTFYDSFELGVDLPFLSFNSGFMDSPINYLHRTVGFSNYGREYRPENDFLYEVNRKGVTIIKGEQGKVGLSDIRLSAKKAIISSDPAVSLKLDIELPTGDAKKGYGSGNLGTDLSLLLDKRVGESFMTYCNLGVAFPGDLDGYETVDLKQFAFGGIALEMSALENFSLLAQFSFQESPYPETGVRPVDATATLLTFGGRYNSQGHGSYEFTFTEDPNTAGAPDFTVGLSYKKKL